MHSWPTQRSADASVAPGTSYSKQARIHRLTPTAGRGFIWAGMNSEYQKAFLLWKQCRQNLKISFVRSIGLNKAAQDTKKAHFPIHQDPFFVSLSVSFFIHLSLFPSQVFWQMLQWGMSHSVDKVRRITVWILAGKTAANSLIRNQGSEGRGTLNCVCVLSICVGRCIRSQNSGKTKLTSVCPCCPQVCDYTVGLIVTLIAHIK